MDSAIVIALIFAGVIIILAIMFYKPMSRRIDSGASFEASIAPSGAKLLLGPSEKGTTTPPSAAQAPQTPEAMLIDSRLIKLIPPLNPKQYKTITLPLHQPPPAYKLRDAPTGVMMINHVPFFLQPVVDAIWSLIGHQVIDIAPGPENTATIEDVPAQVEEAAVVHFLLSAGNGHVSWKGVQFLGKPIGYIELLFADNNPQPVPLILGKHLREWAFENFPGLVRDIDPNVTQPAWVSYDNAHRIDMMSVAITGGPKTLKTIRVVAKFGDEQFKESMALPAIIISAITCERKM